LESELAAKQASLPKEPLQNDEGAVTVVVRMPDGSRQGRRFIKTDKLQVNNFEMPESRTKSSISLLSFFFSVFFFISE